jgi:predicted outer membrane repeat protein
MKKTITLLFALFTAVLSAQTVSIQGGSSYGTITDAITAAIDGDVILITGTHTESITINKSITLRGSNPATDIIQAATAASTAGGGTRVISIVALAPATTAALNVTVENLTIRYGNITGANGGGINVDKITGLVNLKNLIVTNNFTTSNGGGIGVAGSNVNITNCTVQNNSCTLDGGAILATPNNAALIDNVVNIKQSLLNANAARNGGGIYINGNLNFGNIYKIAVNIENSTVSNNTTTSTSTGNGGGAILSLSQPLVSNSLLGNVTLSLVHATVYNNVHASPGKAGLQFLAPTVTAPTNFSAYNSIIVGNDDLTATGPKAINFTNTNITNIVNCIFGGTTLPPTIVSDPVPNTNNNEAGKTATYAGLTGTLTNEGGNTQVIKLNVGGKAVDYCSAATGISIPTIDQRGYSRAGTQDAGAYELGGALSVGEESFKSSTVSVYPNPSSEMVTVGGLNNVSAIKVYSTLGSKVKEIYNQNQVNVSDLSAGAYIMMIESDGQKITKRIIIE